VICVFVIPEMTEQGGLMPCASIRLLFPLTKEVVANAVKVRFASVDDLEFQRADVVIAHRISLSSLEDIERIRKYCGANNAKFVYDIDDDFLALGSDHTQSATYQVFKPIIEFALTSADQIWVSTQTLADRYRQFGRDIAVVPNALDRRVWKPASAAPRRNIAVQFLYMGTTTHREDFSSLVLPGFRRLREEFGDKINLSLIGVTDERHSDAGYSTVDVSPGIALTYPAFANWLQSLGPYDIGLAPLLDTSFNRAKSDIKLLEYSALGLATIAADLPPYRNSAYSKSTVLVEPTADAFYLAMRSLVIDSNRRRDLQDAACVIARENVWDAENEEPRLQLIEELASRIQRPAASSISNGRVENREGDRRQAAYNGVPLKISPAEMTPAQIIKESGLFDPVWYVNTYQDVAASGMDPLEHYLQHGAQERRNPSAHFDAEAYLSQHPDILNGVNPLLHYVVYGRNERRAIYAVGKRDYEFMPPVRNPGPFSRVPRCFAFYFAEKPQPVGARVDSLENMHRAERELAKQYGLEGFCYYTDGLTGAEPQNELLKCVILAKDQFPFCVCWTGAREGERRASELSPISRPAEKPFALSFSEQVIPFLQSPNYLRIDGRAVLLVYGAAFLQNVAEMAEQWRNCARERGLGELFLVSTQDPDMGPVLSGFDASVTQAPDANGRLVQGGTDRSLDRSFDYRELVKRSYHSTRTGSASFTTVWAGPEDDGLSLAGAAGLRHASPAAFQEFLENTCRAACKPGLMSEPVIFVSAWNGSPDGASLRPSSRYGHAYLNATAKALQTVGTLDRARKLAVIAHVYYDDIWPEIAKRLRRWKVPFHLYASVPQERAERISNLICADFPKAHVTSLPNRGRDIAPFLHQAQLAIADGAGLICKIHTKKSSHRADGDEWRRDLYEKLLGDESYPEKIVEAFARNSALGIVAPEGHLIPATFYWGANADRVRDLLQQLGYPGNPDPMMFAAGTMFWIRSQALAPIFRLAIRSEDFEEELRQVDGTLAHAIERIFPIVAKMGGYRIADTRVVTAEPFSSDQLRSDLELAIFENHRPNYRFAPASHHA
jgi:glycosyltransferase involved in cell wall biosynthesis